MLVAVVLGALAAAAGAGGDPGYVLEAGNELADRESLQRGARLFVNYCHGCHAASYTRYSRVARDLGLSENAVANSLIFTGVKITEPMLAAIRPEDAENWFGVTPPDLSVIARSRGTDWLYTFLQSFYVDARRPTGVNNLKFPDTAMPHVLWELQGLQRAVYRTERDHHGDEIRVFERFEPLAPGRLTAGEYQDTVRDLVNFLEYLGEPAKLVRYRIGFWAIVYLLGFLGVAYLLKREYWKDVH